jgi:hypothetical protein
MISATIRPTAIDRGVNSRMCGGFWGPVGTRRRIVSGPVRFLLCYREAVVDCGFMPLKMNRCTRLPGLTSAV